MSGADRDRGELAIVLHSHMPYVEGFGTWPFGEEWLFEAIATAYLPILELCERWAEAGARDLVTIGITPVLADQLILPGVGDRFLDFIRGVRVETHRLDTEGLERAGQSLAAKALRHSAHEYAHAADYFEQLDGDLIAALRRLDDQGVVELWASSATHAVLPLLATEAGIRLQVETGVQAHRFRFGRWSGGFWLPECAFRAGIDEQLASAGVRAFCVYLPSGDPLASLEPIASSADSIAVPIDWPTISLVWDDCGYPADPVYRDYHSPTLNGLRPYRNGGGPYDAEAAVARAREHAVEFVARVIERLDHYLDSRGRAGLVVCALDTELLGHWWHEGPAWLAAVVEQARSVGLALTTLPEALERHEPVQMVLGESSWGAGKDLGTWDSPGVAELVWSARKAELGLVQALDRTGLGAEGGALERSARELLALQSSDWAFMATRELAADYPQQRVRGHAAAFEQALATLREVPAEHSGGPNEAVLPVIDARLRGLAPGLKLSTLLEPPSAWGRSGLSENGTPRVRLRDRGSLAIPPAACLPPCAGK
jgi:1,4-alpha-glucan branching enzyme